jgi:hypothetical protein
MHNLINSFLIGSLIIMLSSIIGYMFEKFFNIQSNAFYWSIGAMSGVIALMIMFSMNYK